MALKKAIGAKEGRVLRHGECTETYVKIKRTVQAVCYASQKGR